MKYEAVSISVNHSYSITIFRLHNIIVKPLHMLLTQIRILIQMNIGFQVLVQAFASLLLDLHRCHDYA